MVDVCFCEEGIKTKNAVGVKKNLPQTSFHLKIISIHLRCNFLGEDTLFVNAQREKQTKSIKLIALFASLIKDLLKRGCKMANFILFGKNNDLEDKIKAENCPLLKQ